MATFEIAGHKYQARKLEVFPAFHVARKLGPTIASVWTAYGTGDKSIGQTVVENMLPLLETISKMPEADCDFIIETCLASVSREQAGGTGWSPVWAQAAKRPMFEDITLPVMLSIVAAVIKENLEAFSSALQSGSIGGSQG